MPLPSSERSDNERSTTPDGLPPQRQPSTVPSFLFISFVLWMIMHNQADDLTIKNHWMDALSAMHRNIENYSAWLNGTASNFTLVSICTSPS